MSDKKKPATYEDLLAAPDDMIAEIIDGELRVSPRPGGPHARGATELIGALLPPFDHGDSGPGGWIILFEPELHLASGEIVVPDLAAWRRERMPSVGEDAYFSIVPDWVCEVMSKSNEGSDRLEKMPIYAQAGVSHAWLVHPMRRSLEVFRLHEAKWLTVGVYRGDQHVRAEPFDAVELDLSRLWRDMPPPTRASEEYGMPYGR